MNYGCKH
ncbi:hypothetical protein Zm00014a_000202 [Zea mays]|nr:hypothetical protein Zm00014a_000202 [Zea mays]